MAKKKQKKAAKPAATKAKKSAPKKVVKKPAPKKPVKKAAVSKKAPPKASKVARDTKRPVAVAAKPAEKAKIQPPRPLMPIRPAPVLKGPMAKTKPLTKKDLDMFREMLLKLRDRIIDEISFLSRESMNRAQPDSIGDLSSHSQHMADQGTDNFDREFAASLLTSGQDVLKEIEEALRRIDNGSFGICESTGRPIEYERLKVLPFARYCVAAQTEIERGRPRFRPFRRTSIQTLDQQQQN
ncbi:MAG: TraR/DksA C4-type zinc finger protein [Kiritimatiellae bacterium]|nr:TraR/DksA C4-type zinc finger protein [Kiritimatiellia bacterium]MCO5068943.1 TraR/DksA C4-type zinc finger protein [Kiritimatiellia bacterium]